MQVRGIDLATREVGDGRPFFWGHGLLGSVEQEDDAEIFDWEAIGQVARAVRYDARGHGRSEATLDPADYRWPMLGKDLLALATAAGAERATLGGLSMGCATTLHAVTAESQRVDALVLVLPPTAWETRPRQAKIYRAVASAVELVGLSPFRALMSLTMLTSRSPHLKTLQQSMKNQLGRSHPRAVVAALRGAADSDLPAPEVLRAVTVPALILTWRGDPAHPVSSAKRLAELLPNSELHVAQSFDDVRGWTSKIRDFLAGLSPPSPAEGPPPPG